jgi:hypothetical protein
MQAVRRFVMCALVLIGGVLNGEGARAEAPDDGGGGALAESARGVLETYCYRCHGKDGRNEGGLNVVTDLKKLVESKRVVPGDPERSKLLKRVAGGDMPPEVDFEDQAENPPPLPRPKPQEVAVLRSWIQAGAIDTAPKAAAERRFISDLEILKAILDDMRKVSPRERRFARYFTITHLENAGYNADQLQTYRHGLSKLINSLSWNRQIKPPTPIGPAGTVLRIDLRDYLWDEGTWRTILAHYPYGLKYDTPMAVSVVEQSACELPYVRADWFVFAASRPPLYHAVLRLPNTIEALERKLDVDAAANIRQDRAARAAFNASGISRNNRLIERHESTNGGYWRSYDFAGNAARKNLFSHPLGPGDGEHDFEHDGGETIFALPNGLNGYMLTDGRGNQIEKGPTEIVRDNKQADGAVVNGISCMSCHNRGLIEKADQVRDMVAKTKAFGKEVAETVMALYPPHERMEELMKGDLERFAAAVKKTGASLSRTEPVFALATQFEGELNVGLAAAEAGLKVKEFQDVLGRSPQLGQALGLLLVDGTIKRDVYVNAFPLLAEARHLTLIEITAPAPTPAPAPARAVARNVPPKGVSQGSRADMSQSVRPFKSPRTAQGLAQGGRAAHPNFAGGQPLSLPDRLGAVPESFFGGDRDRFQDIGPSGGVLAGVRVSYKPFLGGPKISSVVPIYRSGVKLIEGELHGTLNGPETTAVAKPGYAVGALRTHTGLGVDGFEMVFMKVKGGRLDPSDSYNSPWLGDVNGGSPRDVMNNGNLVVGLQGRASGTVRALGLIVVK